MAIPPSAAKQQARELVSKALDLNPDLAEARASLGLLLASEYDFANAEKELRRAISLNPSYSNAHSWLGMWILANQGRYRECLEELSLAELADPMSIAVVFGQFMWLMLYDRNIDESARKVAKAKQLYPQHPLTEEMNILFHIFTGNYTRAIELLVEAIDVEKKPYTVRLFHYLVGAYSAIGNREEAGKWLAKLEKLPEETPGRPLFIAVAYAGLGDWDQFFIWANRASEEKSWHFGRLRLSDPEIPAMRNMHKDPRFIELFKKVGLDA